MKKYLARDIISEKGQRYIEVPIHVATHNLCTRCTRDCTFNRRGDCWLHDYLGDKISCYLGYIWHRVNSKGYVLDRDDGIIGNFGYNNDDISEYTWRIDNERYLLGKFGKRKTLKNGKFIKI